MGDYHCEPPLSQLFDDPMMRALMHSDHVDPRELCNLIREVRQRIAATEQSPRAR